MIYFWVVVLLLPTFGREEHLCNAFAAKRINQFTVIFERTVIQYALNKQGIADILLLSLWRVPKEVSVLVYDLFA